MSIHAQLSRIREATGARTQADIARILGIKQPSIAAAIRTGRVPARWYMALMRQGISPTWIESGTGNRHVA